MKKYLFVVLMLISGVSSATLISSSGDPALAGSTVIDFDGAATQDGTSFTFGDVTFSTSGGTLRIAPFGEGGSTWMGSGQTLTTRYTSSPSSFIIDFAAPVSAFGMDWGAANPDWGVVLYDSLNNVLENVVFVGGNSGATFSEFYGVSNPGGIARVELTSVSGFDWVIIDDFQYVSAGSVPEPVTVTLLGLGLAGIGFSRKRKS